MQGSLNFHFDPIVARERDELRRARQAYEHLYRSAEEEPLVSVTIPTWNRAELLVEQTLPSVLAQTYPHLEVVIVGDHCTDDTERRLRKIRDTRVRWVNLPVRGDYPPMRKARWQVAGTAAVNHAIRVAHGQWIAHLDDDDVFTADHIEQLLRHARCNDLELAYGDVQREVAPGQWELRAPLLTGGGLSVFSASILRSYLRFFECDIDAWRIDWAGDQHRWFRMKEAGVRSGWINRVVLHSPMRPGQKQCDYLAEDREDIECLECPETSRSF